MKTHLLDRKQQPHCGLAPAWVEKTTKDPDKATCKTCIKYYKQTLSFSERKRFLAMSFGGYLNKREVVSGCERS